MGGSTLKQAHHQESGIERGKGKGGGIIPRTKLSAADEFRKGKSWPSVVYPLPTPLDSSYSMVTRMVTLGTLNEL